MSARIALEEQSRRIDLRIKEAQESVAILRSQPFCVLPARKGVAESSTSVENLRPVDTDNASMVYAFAFMPKKQLGSLRLERMRLQQVIDAMDNETLPGFEEEYVARILTIGFKDYEGSDSNSVIYMTN